MAQFGLKTLLGTTTAAAMVLALHVCPPPAGPLLMKVAGGMVMFVPVLTAVYLAEWLEQGGH